MRALRPATAVAAALLVLPATLGAQTAHPMGTMSAASLEWAPIQPPGFDAGMAISVLLGNPSVPDEPYTLRLRFADGYRFPAHCHPRSENLTVLSGTFLLAMGAREEQELTAYAPGDFLHIVGTNPHYGGATGETVIQLHGVGPFDVLLASEGGCSGG